MRSAGFALTLTLILLVGGPAHAQRWRTIESSRQQWEEKRLDVRVEYSAGRLEILPGSGELLYHLKLRLDEEKYTPLTEYDVETGALRLGVLAREDRRELDSDELGKAQLHLSPDVAMDLEVEFGVGEARLDLGGLALRSLDVSTGASDASIRFGSPNRVKAEHVRLAAGAAKLEVWELGNTGAEEITFKGGVGSTLLDFGGTWTRDTKASVDVGVGAVVLRLPRDIGVRVKKTSFLASFDANGLVERDGAFYSTNWDSAPHRLTIAIGAALGAIEVEWTR